LVGGAFSKHFQKSLIPLRLFAAFSPVQRRRAHFFYRGTHEKFFWSCVPMQNIGEIISRAREILTEKNVTDVALVVYRKNSFRLLAKLHWLDDDKPMSKIVESDLIRIAGIVAVESDGISFESLNGTSEKQARAIIKGLMAAHDLREIKNAVLG
jgi:hypothetical protein